MLQDLNFWLIGGGLAMGLMFGAIVQRSRFCALAAVSNWVLMRDLRQIHGYLAAVAVAVAGTAVLEHTGLVPVAETAYRSAHVDWLGAVAGGVVFGIGMVLAGGCVGRLLVRGAEGSASALVALFAVALGAAATSYGVLEPVRSALAESTVMTLASDDSSLAAVLGLPSWLVAAAVVLACVLVVVPAMRRNASTGLVIAGALVGALVVASWYLTGNLARDEFDMAAQRPVSLTFAAPLAQSVHSVTSGEPTGNAFLLMLVAGALVGAFGSAVAGGGFRWSMPASRELARVLLGGGLMGTGAVFAGGCNIGQGLTGMSTCSISALLAVAGIVAGMRLGLAWLLRAENAPAEEQTSGTCLASVASETAVQG